MNPPGPRRAPDQHPHHRPAPPVAAHTGPSAWRDGFASLLRRLGSFFDRITGRPQGPMAAHLALGLAGEETAARFLKRAGYRVLARNVKVPMGEADLVCESPDGATIVIVEVKSRRVSPAPGPHATIPPEAAITARKRRKLRAIAAFLRRVNRWEARAMRIDVIAVEFDSTAPNRVLDVRHHERWA